ncbi:MAG: phage holin family protein [Chloroflexi bacterium]|nr:phage holin family protein [Chloroflexota bacterium]
MSQFLLRLLANALAVLVASTLFPKLISVERPEAAVLFALVLGVLNAFLRPVLLLLSFPLTILTLGLFTLVVNAIIFWLAGLLAGGMGVNVNGFGAAFLGALVVSVVSFFSSRLFK